jgi:hypothetical protein
MGPDLAAANVNRAYQLSATSIAIFTFMLIFLYPRFSSGEVNALLFQATLIVMAVAVFSFVFTTFYYYAASLSGRFDDAHRASYARRGDRFWLVGYSLLLADPALILLCVGLGLVASVWSVLWLAYLFVALRNFPRVQTARRD